MPAIDHIRYLAETIGPRGSTTPQEAEAARYAAGVLKKPGLEPITETFTSARSAWYPYALFAGLVLLSELLFWTAGSWGAVAAALLTVVALASVLLELAFRSNPFRWILPKGGSQNVWARRMPRGEVRRQVVLMGHLDTHRTPLAFSTDRWVRLFSRLVPIGLVSAIALLLLFIVGAWVPGLIGQAISLPFALVIFGVFLITVQADFSPYTAGANDNATGAGIVLSLAERLAQEPLNHTAVWLVLSGCEEVGCYGAEDFARRHGSELGRAIWITVDSVGGTKASPAYLTHETFLLTARSDPELVAWVEQIARQHPEWDVHPHHFRGAYTEGSIAAKYGFRVLTFTGHRRDGVLPEWHRPTDTVEHLEPRAVEHTEALLWELLQVIDQSPGGG